MTDWGAARAVMMLTVVLLSTFAFCALHVDAKKTDHPREERQLHNTPTPDHHIGGHHDMSAWLSQASSSKPNVLFLIADDLRPKLGCYGDTNMITPNIDYLAGRSVRFDQAFSQMAVCSPSRTSFLTGRRPLTTRILDLVHYFRHEAGNFTTLPQHFKNNGYFTQGVGKVFHPGSAAGGTGDYPYSWSAKTFLGEQPFNNQQRKQAAVHPVNESESGKLKDTTVADFAVNFLQQHATNNPHQPFFLAVGFHKPHLPWIFPQQYLDLYPLSKIHLAQHRTRPTGVPHYALTSLGEILNFQDVQGFHTTSGIFADHDQLVLRQAYSAAVSFTDALVGRVLDALSHNGFSSNTIVVFLGDHGWHLGDNAQWGKHTNFDMAIRIPMMIYVPGVTSYAGPFHFQDALAPNFNPAAPELHRFGDNHSTSELVEAVDLYPTLAELAGLPVPRTCPQDSSHVALCTEGTSLVPLLRRVRDLTHSDGSSFNFTWKQAAHSVYPRNWNSHRSVLGYSVRTKTHRYTEWVSFNTTSFTPDFDQVQGRELYDHSDDPYEFHNLANDASHSSTVQQMSSMVRQGWRHTLTQYLNTLHGATGK